jgi:hypothetical protein
VQSRHAEDEEDCRLDRAQTRDRLIRHRQRRIHDVNVVPADAEADRDNDSWLADVGVHCPADGADKLDAGKLRAPVRCPSAARARLSPGHPA